MFPRILLRVLNGDYNRGTTYSLLRTVGRRGEHPKLRASERFNRSGVLLKSCLRSPNPSTYGAISQQKNGSTRHRVSEGLSIFKEEDRKRTVIQGGPHVRVPRQYKHRVGLLGCEVSEGVRFWFLESRGKFSRVAKHPETTECPNRDTPTLCPKP